ncbi:hypothetical protein B0J13DRAFT_232877 [Dactylonectria estremocensis]|uniref:Uncharacterized protein n=1 Tax=Dactylonectria estremocensis TaxID=1079267 RepID=A0A9P9JCM9_9HYPO|nr:hypothetical protein B0J13DRAFT_232877 [Dactylonectria estremocensis]
MKDTIHSLASFVSHTLNQHVLAGSKLAPEAPSKPGSSRAQRSLTWLACALRALPAPGWIRMGPIPRRLRNYAVLGSTEDALGEYRASSAFKRTLFPPKLSPSWQQESSTDTGSSAWGSRRVAGDVHLCLIKGHPNDGSRCIHLVTSTSSPFPLPSPKRRYVPLSVDPVANHVRAFNVHLAVLDSEERPRSYDSIGLFQARLGWLVRPQRPRHLATNLP